MVQNRNEAVAIDNLIQGHFMVGERGAELDCRQAISIGRAYGDLISPKAKGTFAIGCSVRETSSSLAEAVSLGLRSGGHHVIHIETCTKSRLEWYINDAQLSGGIMIGVGNLSPHLNGLRLYSAHAKPIPASALLNRPIETDLNCLFTDTCDPILSHEDPLLDYAAYLRRWFQPQNYFKLCLDVGNGVAGAEFDAVISHYPHLRIWRIGFPQPDAHNPSRGPDPFSLKPGTRLVHCVKNNGCHLGASIEADGGQLAIVDEQGKVVPSDTIGTLLALALSTRHERFRVLYSEDVRPHLLHTLAKAGIDLHQIKGDPEQAHVSAWDALHNNANLFFDSLGHYAFAEFPGTANALLALIELINHLTLKDESLSSLVRTFDHRT